MTLEDLISNQRFYVLVPQIVAATGHWTPYVCFLIIDLGLRPRRDAGAAACVAARIVGPVFGPTDWRKPHVSAVNRGSHSGHQGVRTHWTTERVGIGVEGLKERVPVHIV